MSDRNILRVEKDSLIVTPQGLDRVWCWRRQVVASLGSITDVRVESSPARVPTGWRGPGLDFMGKLCGTFHPNGERHFWNYSGSGDALSIGIAKGQHHFQRLYLSVSEPERSREVLLDAVSSRGSG